MVDRENVIKGLEKLRCVSEYDHRTVDCYATADLCNDTLELLKAQEPRVMTLEEVKKLRRGDDVYVERRLYVFPNILYAVTVAESEPETEVIFWTDRLLLKDYNVNQQAWRCWTSRPKDAQREATPWAN